MSAVLQECPFCSGENAFLMNAKRGMVVHHWIECANCGASGPPGFSAVQAINGWKVRASDIIAITEIGKAHLEGRK